MDPLKKNSVLIYEEVKAVKFFLWAFYIILFAYDLAYYFFIPQYGGEGAVVGFPDGSMGFVMHFLLLLLLPVAIYFIKKGTPEKIKYMYIFSFMLLDFINNALIFWGNDKEFTGGHILEVYFILFSPIFVDKRFFMVASIGLFLKYLLDGFLFHSNNVIFPIALIIFISSITWVLLSRFQSYITAITAIHEDLRQKEKLAVIGQMATAIAHEIRNPLSSLKGFTQLQQEKDKEDDHYYPIMLSEIDRINSIVTNLLILGRPNTAEKNTRNLRNIIEYVLVVIETHADRMNINIDMDLIDAPGLLCDENQLKQVFINLIKNAMESMPDGGTVKVTSESEDGFAIVSIRDEGCGIDPAKLQKLGEPFYTTKENGNGLGLMVTKKIIEEHGGRLIIESELDNGTTVTVTLPIYE
ncbi:ATP-binding protein [Mesobacillus subterraneus]|uniref:ATP-binding protein n=1 Tax=Mesobacillus subterraneus TaxID=285983 RepID=UPI001CFF5249|nr:ATP-binding protein [Mesobacillus subterraneus]WLR54357.1 ATP-binding protein [Mesobacillus subterraneus]